MKWYLVALRKYACFSGRARRKEFWMFAMFNQVLSALALFTGSLISMLIERPEGTLIAQIAIGLYSLAILIPGIAVAVRRLHDTGKSGWLLLLGLIPLVGGIILFIFMLQNGDPGENKYGADPKEAERLAGKDHTKASAVFLTIAAFFWVCMNSYSLILDRGWTMFQYSNNPVVFVLNQLFIVVPVALLFYACTQLNKNDKSIA